MSLKEIEKLREKVAKDPNSKLFVPLADEYRKEGMLDEAIEVLTKGLEKQPSYTSARVALGKIYLEKSMLAEAQKEFEGVVKSVPDNLFAQKKLAEIYRDTGQSDLALKAFRSVLRLNPMDEETISIIKEIESHSQPAPPAAPTESEEEPLAFGPSDKPTGVPAEADYGADVPVGMEPAPETKTSVSPDELTEFRDMVFGSKNEDESAPVLPADEHPLSAAGPQAEEALTLDDFSLPEEETDLPEEPALDVEEEAFTRGEPSDADELTIVEENAAASEDLSLEDEFAITMPDESSPEEAPAGEPGSTGLGVDMSFADLGGMPEAPAAPAEDLSRAEAAATEAPAETVEEFSFAEPAESDEAAVPEEEIVFAEEAVTETPALAIEEFSFGDGGQEVASDMPPVEPDRAAVEEVPAAAEAFTGTAEPESAAGTAGLVAEADRLIGEGNYIGAIEKYQKIMALEPDNAATLQRIEELRALLKLMGKDKDVLITRLNGFLDAVHKRRDEFFRRSQGNG
ncbi:MAG: hypothetical protein OHK006_18820 [Thermodesulfovibrionales bacterium]